MDPFWDKLIWMLIDKLLLAGAGALIAYLAARALERYRRDQAMVLELGKFRAQAFARLMSLLGEHSAFVAALAGGLERTEENLRFLNSPERLAQLRQDLYTTIPRDMALLDPALRSRLKTYVETVYEGLDLRKADEKPLSKDVLAAWGKKVKETRDAVMELVPRLPKH